ncbi:hypothetical protein INT47_000416, partial [Mucor saturninus]
FFAGASRRYYAQMDEESENEEDHHHSLFYSVHQPDIEDSIPLTLSNAYSDRSQLLFEQSEEEEEVTFHHSQDENPKPSAIYLVQPDNSPYTYSTPIAPLSESLLPTSASIPPGISTVDRKYRDPIFAILYCLCLAVFILSGFIILFSTNSHSIEDYVKGSTFKTIKDSAGILTIIISVALLTILSFVPFIVNLVYIKVIFDSRHRINKTVSVIELACDVIRYNPGIILVSLLLLAVFIVFSIVWIIFFNRLWLIGHLGDASGLAGTTWVVHNYVYSLAAFYVFIYMWTAKLLIYMERFALSSITAQWYFHRNDPAGSSVSPWKSALIRASTNSLGTIAFGSLILAVIQFLQFSARSMRKYTKVPRPFATLITILLGYIDAMISIFNNYTISLAGITGENFFSAAKSATKIFRRNLLSGLFGDLLTQLIIYIGTTVIALSSGFGAYIYATHQLHSSGFVVGLVATLMPWYLSQFFSYTMMSIIDASFLCYAIDLDTGKVHLSAAHTAFAGFD